MKQKTPTCMICKQPTKYKAVLKYPYFVGRRLRHKLICYQCNKSGWRFNPEGKAYQVVKSSLEVLPQVNNAS